MVHESDSSDAKYQAQNDYVVCSRKSKQKKFVSHDVDFYPLTHCQTILLDGKKMYEVMHQTWAIESRRTNENTIKHHTVIIFIIPALLGFLYDVITCLCSFIYSFTIITIFRKEITMIDLLTKKTFST